MNPEINQDTPFSEREYTQGYRFKLSFLHPRYWLLWLFIGLLFLIGHLPLPWVLATGRTLGRLFLKLGGSRVKITRRNLELCFPEKSEQEREQLLKKNFEAIGIALLEPGVAWFSSSKRIRRIARSQGFEEVGQLLKQGQPILLSALHMTSVEMACRVASEYISFNILYRTHDNPVYEYVSGVRRNSYPHKSRFIPRKQVKDLLYFMKRGEAAIILPDHDLGKKRSLFVPFFGISTATVPSTADFARQTGARVVTATYSVGRDNKYDVNISSPLENFPTADNLTDTALISQLNEDYVRQHPDQYLWQHRRFKTRPEGEASLYN